MLRYLVVEMLYFFGCLEEVKMALLDDWETFLATNLSASPVALAETVTHVDPSDLRDA